MSYAHRALLLGLLGGGTFPAPTDPSPANGTLITDTTPDISFTLPTGATSATVRLYDVTDTLVYENTNATSPVTISPALVPANGPFTLDVFANPAGQVASVTFDFTYIALVLSIETADLIQFLPMDETSGTAPQDATANNRDGTSSGVTWNSGTFLDGTPAGLWTVAASSTVNAFSAGLASAYSNAEFTWNIWLKAASGARTDGLNHYLGRIRIDGSNEAECLKTATNNTMSWQDELGGVNKTVSSAVLTNENWHMYSLVRSKDSDQVIAYWDAVQVGSTQTGLGTPAGSLTAFSIGSNLGASLFWAGNLRNSGLWKKPLSQARLTSLFRVPVAT